MKQLLWDLISALYATIIIYVVIRMINIGVYLGHIYGIGFNFIRGLVILLIILCLVAFSLAGPK